MELKHRQIPVPFLQAIPEGMKYLKKDGKDYLVVERLFCPNGHNMIVDTVRIHDERAVRLQLKVGESEGAVFIDAFWGGHAKLYGFVPDLHVPNPIVTGYCSVCHADLMEDVPCTEEKCGSKKSIVFRLPGGENKIFVCARLGCPGHRIEVVDMPDKVSREVSRINYFGAQTEDMLMEI